MISLDAVHRTLSSFVGLPEVTPVLRSNLCWLTFFSSQRNGIRPHMLLPYTLWYKKKKIPPLYFQGCIYWMHCFRNLGERYNPSCLNRWQQIQKICLHLFNVNCTYNFLVLAFRVDALWTLNSPVNGMLTAKAIQESQKMHFFFRTNIEATFTSWWVWDGVLLWCDKQGITRGLTSSDIC